MESMKLKSVSSGEIDFAVAQKKSFQLILMRPLVAVMFLLVMVLTLFKLLSSLSSSVDYADGNGVTVKQEGQIGELVQESRAGELVYPKDFSEFSVGECAQADLPVENVKKALLGEIYGGSTPYHNLTGASISSALQKINAEDEEQVRLYEEILKEVLPETVLQIGSSSTINMAKAAKTLGLNNTIFIIVDDFRGAHPPFGDVLDQFLQNVVEANLTDCVVPVAAASTAALRWLCRMGVKVDLVKVSSGDHDFHSTWIDMNLSWLVLRRKKGATAMMFGYGDFMSKDRYGIRRAVDLFAQVNYLQADVNEKKWTIKV